jgi:hypothetical protein
LHLPSCLRHLCLSAGAVALTRHGTTPPRLSLLFLFPTSPLLTLSSLVRTLRGGLVGRRQVREPSWVAALSRGMSMWCCFLLMNRGCQRTQLNGGDSHDDGGGGKSVTPARNTMNYDVCVIGVGGNVKCQARLQNAMRREKIGNPR